MEIQHLLTAAGQEKEDMKIRSSSKNVINGIRAIIHAFLNLILRLHVNKSN